MATSSPLITPTTSPIKPALLQVIPYSAESCLITGEGTFSVKERLKAAGGRWNDRLKGATSKGWIFPLHQLAKCEELVARLLAEGQVHAGTPLRGRSSANSPTNNPNAPNVIENTVKTTRGETNGATWERVERTEIVFENGQKVETVTITQTQRRVII